MTEMNLPYDFCLLRPSETNEDTFRDAYNAACEHDGMMGEESPLNMLKRTGRFIYAYLDELNDIEKDILTNSGLFDIVIPPKMGDIKDMSHEDASRLWNVSYAKVQGEIVRADFIKFICASNTETAL